MSRALETRALFPGDLRSRQIDLYAAEHRENKLWLAAYFPNFSLEACANLDTNRATVIAELKNGCRRVIAANDKAIALGIRPPIDLSAAYALSDSFEVLERCEKSERARLEALADQARQFTSVLSLEPPAALLLEIGGSIKLFGGVEAIKDALGSLFAKECVTVHLCAAPTALGALWLARCGQEDVLTPEELAGRLSRVPIEATEWPVKTQVLLAGMGIRTLGECMRLPRDGFARRVGRQYLQELDKSRGSHDPRREYRPVLELTARAELTIETGDIELLVNLGKRLIECLVEDLRKHQVQIPGFECMFHHLDNTATIERIRFAEPAQDEARFIRLFIDRLENMRLMAPVIGLSLKTEPTEPAIASHGALFGNDHGVDAESLGSLIERLQSRFGMDSLYGVDLVEGHRPEAAWTKTRRFRQQERRSPLRACQTPPRPLWLLPAPRRLTVTADNLPCYKGREPLRISHGPERIESGWWDGGEIGRDYYVAVGARGEKLWIFQDRCVHRSWYLHGFFG